MSLDLDLGGRLSLPAVSAPHSLNTNTVSDLWLHLLSSLERNAWRRGLTGRGV